MDSAMTEFAPSGKVLVKEQGTLPGTQVHADLACDDWTAGLGFTATSGSRDYAGQTSLGAPLSTRSQIDDSVFKASLYWQATPSVRLGADISQQHTRRDIQGTSTVSGYPEVYDRLLARLGAQWDIPSPLGLWTLMGAASVHGEQTMNLQLPGKDSATLQFNAPRQWELGIQWRQKLGQHLFVQAAYRYIVTDIDQSKDTIITSSGIPVGIAYQPRTQLTDQPFSIGIGLDF